MKLLSNLDARTAFALARLVESDEFKVVMAYLEEQERKLDVECRLLDGPVLYRRQGGALLVNEFLTVSRDAREIAAKIRETRTRASQ